jgi:hypothetical protein
MSFICSNSVFSLAQKSRIESRIASPGNRTLRGGQASENIPLTHDDVLFSLISSLLPCIAADFIV